MKEGRREKEEWRRRGREGGREAEREGTLSILLPANKTSAEKKIIKNVSCSVTSVTLWQCMYPYHKN